MKKKLEYLPPTPLGLKHLVPNYYFAFSCRPLGTLVRFRTSDSFTIWAYGFSDSLFSISMSPTAILGVRNTIFNDKSAMLLHPGTH